MTNILTSLAVLFFLFAPQAQAEVKMGAGSLKSAQSATPSTEEKIERDEKRAMDEAVKAKKKLVPLAESVSNMFRPQLIELRDTLVNRTLTRLPKNKREEKRPEFEAYIDIDQLQSIYTQTLLDFFTEEELKALRTFMADDAGHKVLTKLPMALDQMRLKRQHYLEKTLEEIIQEEVYEKARKGEPSLLAP